MSRCIYMNRGHHRLICQQFHVEDIVTSVPTSFLLNHEHKWCRIFHLCVVTLRCYYQLLVYTYIINSISIVLFCPKAKHYVVTQKCLVLFLERTNQQRHTNKCHFWYSKPFDICFLIYRKLMGKLTSNNNGNISSKPGDCMLVPRR